jgi:hypothetical protein
MWTDLNEHIVVLLVTILMVTAQVVHIKFFVHLGHHQVENRDQVSGVVFHLTVELGVVRENVTAVDIEHRKFKITDFFKFFNIVGHAGKLFISAILIDFFLLHEVVDELFEFYLHRVRLNIGAPEHCGVGSHLSLRCHLELGRRMLTVSTQANRSTVNQVLDFINT